jgi:hypothetical protein
MSVEVAPGFSPAGAALKGGAIPARPKGNYRESLFVWYYGRGRVATVCFRRASYEGNFLIKGEDC